VSSDPQGGYLAPPEFSSEMLKEIVNERPSNPQCKECAGILRELFGQPKKIQGIYKWRVPLKAGQFDKLLPDPIDDDDKY